LYAFLTSRLHKYDLIIQVYGLIYLSLSTGGIAIRKVSKGPKFHTVLMIIVSSYKAFTA